MRLRLLLLALVMFAPLLSACGGAAHVTFDRDQCLIDGRPATAPEVEAAQARIAQRVLDRQPLYTGVTVAILLLAGASHIEKLYVLFAARKRVAAGGLGERVKVVLDRYRAHPVRYFGIVAVTLSLLGVAGGLYLYLDADKRASERALGQLQFCQLAHSSADAELALVEQRKNLDALQTTAGDIKQLVDSLPPVEQRKAQDLLATMRGALAAQEKVILRDQKVALDVQQRSDAIQKGLGALNADVTALRTLPGQLREIDGQMRKLDGRSQADAKLLGDGIAGLRQQVGELVARPQPACPAVVCKCENAQKSAPSLGPPARPDGGARL